MQPQCRRPVDPNSIGGALKSRALQPSVLPTFLNSNYKNIIGQCFYNGHCYSKKPTTFSIRVSNTPKRMRHTCPHTTNLKLNPTIRRTTNISMNVKGCDGLVRMRKTNDSTHTIRSDKVNVSMSAAMPTARQWDAMHQAPAATHSGGGVYNAQCVF